jgi:ATP-binding protein involved in chromosome partitioning
MNTNIIREKLENLIDESTNSTLKATNAIKHIGIDDEKNVVILIIRIGQLGTDAEKNLRHQIAKIIKLDLGFNGVKIQFEEDKKVISPTTKFIIVASGKGGVGKSTVAANLAYALRRMGKIVGIIDADIYGASIPDILEMPYVDPDINEEERIIPFQKFGMEVISTEFFAEREKAILWRGSQLKSLLTNFFLQVAWNPKMEYIIIDAPSGTGDVMLDLKNIVPSAEVLLVTTPHELDAHMTIKTGLGFMELNQSIIGIVENMAFYLDPDTSDRTYPFFQGGASLVAQKLNSEVLATLPLSQPKHHFALFESDEETGQIFDDLALLISIR